MTKTTLQQEQVYGNTKLHIASHIRADDTISVFYVALKPAKQAVHSPQGGSF